MLIIILIHYTWFVIAPHMTSAHRILLLRQQCVRRLTHIIRANSPWSFKGISRKTETHNFAPKTQGVEETRIKAMFHGSLVISPEKCQDSILAILLRTADLSITCLGQVGGQGFYINTRRELPYPQGLGHSRPLAIPHAPPDKSNQQSS